MDFPFDKCDYNMITRYYKSLAIEMSAMWPFRFAHPIAKHPTLSCAHVAAFRPSGCGGLGSKLVWLALPKPWDLRCTCKTDEVNVVTNKIDWWLQIFRNQRRFFANQQHRPLQINSPRALGLQPPPLMGWRHFSDRSYPCNPCTMSYIQRFRKTLTYHPSRLNKTDIPLSWSIDEA